ncbi:phosphotransferase enzyme family protein [Bacillus sp. J33]|uniref:phosphotransferase enzyme family protein n=1 Tax=Bacillus sp. J33 TaxID=935836 RepID=UPI00047CCB18|nr:phosphotransferase [Bacillus sp. J33]
MEKDVEFLLTSDILSHFFHSYSLDALKYKKLGDFENYVYEVYKNETSYILRVTHSSHRKKKELLAEVDWVNFLNTKGISVPKVYQSDFGKIVEMSAAEDGSIFYASLFSKVPGKPVRVTAPEFNKRLFKAWGRAIGHMHAATKTYTPANAIAPRMLWEDEELLQVEKYVPETDKLVIKNTQALLLQLKSLPKTKDNFGLIHTDVHSGNFCYDGSEIHIYDFDDCCYHWFASDIAIPLYYSLLYRFKENNVGKRDAFGKRFLDSFIEGYQERNTLPDDLEMQLPLFLRLRDVTLYSVLHKKIAPEERDEELELMIQQIKSRIEKNESIY